MSAREQDRLRKLACEQNRLHLERNPALVPRDLEGRIDLGGMLQHHRHATATLAFFLDWFRCDLRRFPVAGVRLIVHARYDGVLPGDVGVLRKCRPGFRKCARV